MTTITEAINLLTKFSEEDAPNIKEVINDFQEIDTLSQDEIVDLQDDLFALSSRVDLIKDDISLASAATQAISALAELVKAFGEDFAPNRYGFYSSPLLDALDLSLASPTLREIFTAIPSAISTLDLSHSIGHASPGTLQEILRANTVGAPGSSENVSSEEELEEAFDVESYGGPSRF